MKKNLEESSEEPKVKILIDNENETYQATCPDFILPQYRQLELLNDRASLVWSPTKDISDNKLEEYLRFAKERFHYNNEQALGMLFWHKHDLKRAVSDLHNFRPIPDEWTEEDKISFERAFQYYGKNFNQIRQIVGHFVILNIQVFRVSPIFLQHFSCPTNQLPV